VHGGRWQRTAAQLAIEARATDRVAVAALGDDGPTELEPMLCETVRARNMQRHTGHLALLHAT
jgi:hypothetical protein